MNNFAGWILKRHLYDRRCAPLIVNIPHDENTSYERPWDHKGKKKGSRNKRSHVFPRRAHLFRKVIKRLFPIFVPKDGALLCPVAVNCDAAWCHKAIRQDGYKTNLGFFAVGDPSGQTSFRRGQLISSTGIDENDDGHADLDRIVRRSRIVSTEIIWHLADKKIDFKRTNILTV